MSSERSNPIGRSDGSDGSGRSGNVDPRTQLEERATAFVFGELNREEATEFMKAMDSSPSLRAVVDSIREAVGALKVEFADTEGWVEDRDRQKIEDAIRGRHPEAPPVIKHGGEDGSSRNWAMALAVAATLLLACGLTLPGLNRVITANTDNSELKEQIREIERASKRLQADNERLASQLATIQRDLRASQASSSIAGRNESLPQQLGAANPRVTLADTQVEEVRVESGTQASDRSAAGGGPMNQIAQGERLNSDPSRSTGASEGQDSGSQDPGNQNPGTVHQGQGGPRAELLADSVGESDAGFTSSDDFAIGIPSGTKPMLGQVDPSRSRPWREGLGGVDPSDLETSGNGNDEMDMMAMMDESAGGMEMGGMTMMGGSGIGGGAGVLVKRDYGRGRSQRDVWGEDLPGDRFATVVENTFEPVGDEPLSTFSVDVDTASYAKVRSYLQRYKRLPDPDAIRIEELVNYFDYHYEPPVDDSPFAASMDVAECPWNPGHRLARIGIKGKTVKKDRPASNLVFLLDVSGSMNRPNRMPLVVNGMKMLVNQLDENDSVAIVVYAGAAGLVLDATTGDRKKIIVDAIEKLKTGGSTNGSGGIRLAYSVARDNFIEGGTNRVILCSDGDFNVGVTDTDELVQLAEDNAKGGLSLTVLGFGVGNHNDEMMEKLSNKGNGNYAFIDNEDEARKVLVEQMQGTLVTIAKDVKIQVEFNPMEVQAYRLIGYENRLLDAKDFADESKDAGGIGAGHTVTALYEIIPNEDLGDAGGDRGRVGELKYQRRIHFSKKADSGELLTVKIRYKQPGGERDQWMEFATKDADKRFDQTDGDFQFAASVAAFGMLLQNSPYKGNASYEMVEKIASVGAIDDRSGYRDEFVSLVRQARKLAGG